MGEEKTRTQKQKGSKKEKMTCKDCLHYEACCSWFDEKVIDATSNAVNNGEIEMCSAFKDKNRLKDIYNMLVEIARLLKRSDQNAR